MNTKKSTLTEIIKGMKVRDWEYRQYGNGREVVYVRFTRPTTTITASFTEA